MWLSRGGTRGYFVGAKTKTRASKNGDAPSPSSKNPVSPHHSASRAIVVRASVVAVETRVRVFYTSGE